MHLHHNPLVVEHETHERRREAGLEEAQRHGDEREQAARPEKRPGLPDGVLLESRERREEHRAEMDRDVADRLIGEVHAEQVQPDGLGRLEDADGVIPSARRERRGELTPVALDFAEHGCYFLGERVLGVRRLLLCSAAFASAFNWSPPSCAV